MPQQCASTPQGAQDADSADTDAYERLISLHTQDYQDHLRRADAQIRPITVREA